MAERNIALGQWEEPAAEHQRQGRTVVWVADAEALLGGIAMGDALRPSAREALALLAAQGIETVMLTGDNRAAADAVGASLGVGRVVAELLPEDKADCVRALQRKGHRVAFFAAMHRRAAKGETGG
jgi:Cu+-exporting ATPase